MHSRIVQHSINLNYKDVLSQQHEWQSDYPWFIKRIKGNKILDLGCMTHAFFTHILCEYGFEVTGVDLHKSQFEIEISLDFRNFHYISSDVRNIPLPDNTFSTIVAPSLLEHIGVGFYKEGKNLSGRIDALTEWHRLLKNNGLLLIQVPYGKKARLITFKGKEYYIIYTAEMIKEEFNEFEIEEIAYHSFEPHGWIQVSKSVADHIDHIRPFPPCIAKILARKE